MRKHWIIVFPAFGLILFSVVSYGSYKAQRMPGKYFYWGNIQLNSDPENKQNPCKDAEKNCLRWDISNADRWVSPGLTERLLVWSALPAFVVGLLSVVALGRLGINQVSSFMFLMPVLIFAWYSLVCWLPERWICKRWRLKIGRELYEKFFRGYPNA
jgi:hypothetical protein